MVLVEVMNGQDLHWIIHSVLGHLNHGQFPVVESQIVTGLEVLFNTHRLFFPGRLVLDVDGEGTGISIFQALDGEIVTRHWAAFIVRLDCELANALVRLVKSLGLSYAAVAIWDRLEEVNQVLEITAV